MGVDIMNCIFCHKAIESVDHILLHCPFVWQIWSAIALWWGFQWAMPSSIEGLLLWWLGWKFKKKVNQVWRALPAAILWFVGRYRNECVFQEVQPNFNDLCGLVIGWGKIIAGYCCACYPAVVVASKGCLVLGVLLGVFPVLLYMLVTHQLRA